MKKLMLIVFSLAVGATLFAQDLTLAQLNQKVQELERRIQLLEKIIVSQSPQSNHNVNQVPAGKEAWRQLKKGMSQDEVRKLLGEPAKVRELGFATEWEYAGGEILFGYNGQLNSWSEN